MKLTIDMPVVSECAVSECVYNLNKACHARAITIGDGVHPGCDTFFGATQHARDAGRRAGVGACKVTGCKHNDDYECSAPKIAVGYQGKNIQCLSFHAR
jgi:hypothetical protein